MIYEWYTVQDTTHDPYGSSVRDGSSSEVD